MMKSYWSKISLGLLSGLSLLTWLILFLSGPVCLQSCEKYKNGECDSFECITIKPTTGYIDIKLTDVGSSGSVPIIIYEGDIDDNNIVLQDTLDTTAYYYELPVDKKYSGAAYYKKAGITTIVTDGTKIKLNGYRECLEKCYSVKDGDLDLRLK